jgi:hypothetical protein
MGHAPDRGITAHDYDRITAHDYDRKVRKLKDRQTEIGMRIEQHQGIPGDQVGVLHNATAAARRGSKLWSLAGHEKVVCSATDIS